MVFTLISGGLLACSGITLSGITLSGITLSGITLAPSITFSPHFLAPALPSQTESGSPQIGAPASAAAFERRQKLEAGKVETKATEIQDALLRIFSLDPDQVPKPRIRLLDSEKFSHRGESAIRAVYLDSTVYLDQSLLQSPQLAHSLRHELVHWIVAALSNGRAPAWLDEGLAQLLAGPKSSLVKASIQKRGRAVRSVRLSSLRLSFHHLDEDSLLLAYARSRMAAQSMVFRWTLPRIKDYLIDLGRGLPEDTCFENHFGESIEEFEASLDRH